MKLSVATALMTSVWFTVYGAWLVRAMILPPPPIRAEGPRPVAARIQIQPPVMPPTPISPQPVAVTPVVKPPLPQVASPPSTMAVAPPHEPQPPATSPTPPPPPSPALTKVHELPPQVPRFGTQGPSADKSIAIELECPAEMMVTKQLLLRHQLQVVGLSTIADAIRSALLPNANGLLELQSDDKRVNDFLDRHSPQVYRWFALNAETLPAGLASLVQHAFDSARVQCDPTWHIYLVVPPQITRQMDDRIVTACRAQRLSLDQVHRVTVGVRLLSNGFDIQVNQVIPLSSLPYGLQTFAPNPTVLSNTPVLNSH
ncbi:MAG: hypothetical protein JNM18_08135 [Planctomycetaceae bacterium]|nr:hypothetical protein [Planctomycetaceae bacterium]